MRRQLIIVLTLYIFLVPLLVIIVRALSASDETTLVNDGAFQRYG